MNTNFPWDMKTHWTAPMGDFTLKLAVGIAGLRHTKAKGWVLTIFRYRDKGTGQHLARFIGGTRNPQTMLSGLEFSCNVWAAIRDITISPAGQKKFTIMHNSGAVIDWEGSNQKKGTHHVSDFPRERVINFEEHGVMPRTCIKGPQSAFVDIWATEIDRDMRLVTLAHNGEEELQFVNGGTQQIICFMLLELTYPSAVGVQMGAYQQAYKAYPFAGDAVPLKGPVRLNKRV
jgi:hypothetical protein